MKKNILMVCISVVSSLVILVFGSLLLHFEARKDALEPPPWKPAHAPEVLKDSGEIAVAMGELAVDTPVHPLESGPAGERAVFQRNPYYLPVPIGRSWETALEDIRRTPYALSSEDAFIRVLSNGLPGTDHPGISGLTKPEWDSAYAQAKAVAVVHRP
jgi:hypothetical protein